MRLRPRHRSLRTLRGYRRQYIPPWWEEMPFGRSDAAWSPSVYRAPVVQRMRALSRAHDVVSTIVCWCSTSQRWWQFPA